MFNPLHSISNQELFEKHLCNPRILKDRNGDIFPSYINYRLKSEVSIKPVTQQYKSREHIVYTAVCQKAPLGPKQHRIVKNQACGLSRYQVTLV